MKAWREWWDSTYGKNANPGGYNPIEGYMYDAWISGFNEGTSVAEKEVAHLKAQLLRVGNQHEVLKAAYLAGQMSRPVKTFSGNHPNYVIPPETE
jgi:hypothetical protein